MVKALHALLGGVVDYAGLFPPAQLALEPALRNFARYRTLPESWMLGRFIIPAAQLAELAPLGEELFHGEPFSFSVLGRGGKESQEYFAGVKADLADIARFCAALGDRVVVDAYEVKLPPSAFGPAKANQLSALVATTAYLIETAGPP